MSDIGYTRCPNDDFGVGTAPIGVNPSTGKAVEININGVASVIALQSAMLTLSAAMKSGYEQDFLEKVALCLVEKLREDRHALCPLLTICGMCLTMITEEEVVTFDDEGHVHIVPNGVDPVNSGPSCMFDYNDDDEEDNEYEPNTPEGDNGGTDGDVHGGGEEGTDGINP